MQTLFTSIFILLTLGSDKILQSKAVVKNTQIGNKLQPSNIEITLLSTNTDHNLVIGYMWSQPKVEKGDTILIDNKLIDGDRVFIITSGTQFRR